MKYIKDFIPEIEQLSDKPMAMNIRTFRVRGHGNCYIVVMCDESSVSINVNKFINSLDGIDLTEKTFIDKK